jgi:hypothetical protein
MRQITRRIIPSREFAVSLGGFAHATLREIVRRRLTEVSGEMRDSSNFNPAGLAIGLGVGVALGVALDNLAIGIAIGTGVGISFSLALARREDDASDGEE